MLSLAKTSSKFMIASLIYSSEVTFLDQVRA